MISEGNCLDGSNRYRSPVEYEQAWLQVQLEAA